MGHGRDEAGEDYGTPILPGDAATDYERYLATDVLLTLQKGPQDWLHRDELLFQVVHQTSELWLKQACSELEEATALVARDEPRAAVRLVGRAALCVTLVTQALDMLEQMSPAEFAEVRRALGHGAGFDSPGFLRLRALAPLLWAELARRLAARGETLAAVYAGGRESDDSHLLAEALVELDERVTTWRGRHVEVVERLIGAGVIGTQGTPVDVLRRLRDERLFDELWDVRTALTRAR